MMALMQAVMKARGVQPGQERADYPKAEKKIIDQNTVAEDTDCIMPKAGFAASKPRAPMVLPAGLARDSSPPKETSLAKQMRVLLGELGGRPVDRLLAELASIASQIASVDLVLEKAVQSAPPLGSEAEKWHELAVNTASWSRQSLVDQQRRCLEKIREVAQAAPAMQQVPTPPPVSPLQRARVPTPPPAQVGGGLPSAPCSVAPESRSERKTKRGFATKGDGSMKKGLTSLRDCDSGCVLIVRKIKKLGFESTELLSKHFLQFGGVTDVHVANSMMKPSMKRPTGRLRPAALGFVVMATAEAAEAALANGSTHVVGPVEIEVSSFSPFDSYGDDE